MKQKYWILSALIILIVCSCGSSSEPLGLTRSGSYDYYADGAVNATQPQESSANLSDSEAVFRKLIKRGDISFETSNANKTRIAINEAVSKYNGYISQDNISDYGSSNRYKLEVRVPAGNFDPLIADISQSASKINSKNITISDVTEEFIDIEARIKTKKELEARYKELLKRANSVSEILTIEKEIGNIRGEIESVEGRMKYLTDRISYSTLTISFYEPGKIEKGSFGFGRKVSKAVGNGWEGLLWFFVGLTSIWPFLLIVAAIVIIVLRIRKRRRTH